MTADKLNAWERHGQTIIAGLILAGIIWVAKEINIVGKDVVDVRSTVSVVSTRLDAMEKSLADIDERFDKYQTKREAELNKETQQLRDKMLHGRIDALEKARDGRQSP